MKNLDQINTLTELVCALENLSGFRINAELQDGTFEKTGNFRIYNSMVNPMPVPKIASNQQEILRNIEQLNDMIRNHFEPRIEELKNQIRSLIV